LLVSKNKIMCTSRRSLVQCLACPLGKSNAFVFATYRSQNFCST
jgi:hypothetical protein